MSTQTAPAATTTEPESDLAAIRKSLSTLCSYALLWTLVALVGGIVVLATALG